MTVLEPVITFIYGLTRSKITLDDLIEGTGRPRKPIIRVMDRLVKGGFVSEVEDTKVKRGYKDYGPAKRNPTWEIITKPMIESFTPRPNKNALRDKMWRLIRARRRFTRRELIRLSGASLGSATDFTQLLVKHKFIRTTGKDGHQNVYMLIKDPGPTRPVTPEVKTKNAK